MPFDESPRAKSAGYLQYGTKWLKGLYRGYTDSSFSTQSEQPSWLGDNGPILRSEVGDMVEIMFVNKLSKAYATMHSMGLAYSKPDEGADYPNRTGPAGTHVSYSNRVPPSGPEPVGPHSCVVYKWLVPSTAGPDHDEPAKVCQMVPTFASTNRGAVSQLSLLRDIPTRH